MEEIRSYKISEDGEKFVKKELSKTFLQIPIFLTVLCFAIFAGYIKIGFSMYGILVFLGLLPILVLYFYQTFIKPRQIIKKVIIQIEKKEEGFNFTTFNKTIYKFATSEISKISKETSKYHSTSKSLFIDKDVRAFIDNKKNEYYIIADYCEDNESLKTAV
jgi:hypothetical protein